MRITSAGNHTVDTTTIIVMYHYVRRPDPNWSGLVPLSPDDFERQLDAMQAIGPIVAPADLEASIASSCRIRFVLTFDDGTKDHYTEVFPRLRRRGLSGLFAVLSGPTLEGYVPTLHLVHALISRLGEDNLWHELRREFGAAELGTSEQAARTYPRETSEARRRAKYALNFALPAARTREFLLRLFAATAGWLEAFQSTWYLNEQEIRAMAEGGMEFAVHGHRHEPWRDDVEGFIAQEVDPCRDWLGSVLNRMPRQYILPFGGRSAQNVNIRNAETSLRKRGITCAHLTEVGINHGGEFWLRRFDCADVPPLQGWPAAIAELLESV